MDKKGVCCRPRGQLGVRADHIPPSPMELWLTVLVLGCGLGQMISGVLLTALGVALSVVINHRMHYHIDHPALWWAGVGPVLLGIGGMYSAVRKNRKHLYKWGMAGILVAITQTALLGVLGAYSPALYNAWPFVGTHHGHPICEFMVDRCYCQDSLQREWSKVPQPGVQYIEEDVRWKDTGFLNCDDLELVSRLYYSTMAMIGIFLLATLLGWVISLTGTVCAPQNMEFQKLEEEVEFEEDKTYMDSSHYQQTAETGHDVTQELDTLSSKGTSHHNSSNI